MTIFFIDHNKIDNAQASIFLKIPLFCNLSLYIYRIYIAHI